MSGGQYGALQQLGGQQIGGQPLGAQQLGASQPFGAYRSPYANSGVARLFGVGWQPYQPAPYQPRMYQPQQLGPRPTWMTQPGTAGGPAMSVGGDPAVGRALMEAQALAALARRRTTKGRRLGFLARRLARSQRQRLACLLRSGSRSETPSVRSALRLALATTPMQQQRQPQTAQAWGRLALAQASAVARRHLATRKARPTTDRVTTGPLAVMEAAANEHP